MLRTELIDLVKITISKKGQKMYFYWSNGASRYIRLKKDIAENLIATEQVEVIE